ncbi:AAA family ATPase [Telmatospirillum sp.]|uniref:AAA family ATPase n=1 Tax=Telmatospirillum sp. TaxID=2079197 RepID=UPI00284F8BAD|nr:AAA family ATPase [Telmatospirillum sp.]MDR3440574.1 AAA family ATPase [Telmatospirillum sp.]
MADYHLTARVVGRSTGRGAVSAAAYRHGARMTDERTDQAFDYRRRLGVHEGGLVIPEDSPAWLAALAEASGRSSEEARQASAALWNRVEVETRSFNKIVKEKGPDGVLRPVIGDDGQPLRADTAQLSREIEVALPVELTLAEQKVLVQGFAREALAGRYGVTADIAIHAYGRALDPANPRDAAKIARFEVMGWERVDHQSGRDVPVLERPHILVTHGPEGGETVRIYQPHAHIMATVRTAGEEGFSRARVRELDRRETLETWREEWAVHQNRALALAGHDIQVDHRSYADRGIALDGGVHRGVGAEAFASAGRPDVQRVAASDEVRRSQADEVRERPALVLELLAEQRSTFTRIDAARVLARWFDDPSEFQGMLARVMAVPDLVRLTADQKGHPARYTLRQTIEIEASLVCHAVTMAEDKRGGVVPEQALAALDAFAERHGFAPNEEQREAVRHVTGKGRLGVIVGHAGSGKSTILEAAKDAWTASGKRVIGAALAGIAAENLQKSGIESRTIAAYDARFREADELAALHRNGVMTEGLREGMRGYLDWWADRARSPGEPEMIRRLREQLEADTWTDEGLRWRSAWAERRLARLEKLDADTVLVIDEAGMVGTRQLDRMLARAEAAGAKVVLVGDPGQLQPIEAGAAFRVILERTGHAALTEVRRQSPEWMRAASGAFAREEMTTGLAAYATRGHVRVGIGLDEEALIEAAEVAHGPLSAGDRRLAVLAAHYVEARRAAGALWMGGEGRPGGPEHAAFKAWQTKRSAAVLALAADIEGARHWLARLGADGVGFAADLLAATGRKRAEAEAGAEAEAARLGLDTLPDEPVLTIDARGGARKALLADWLASRAAAPDRSRLILAHTRRDVAELNRMARAALQTAGAIGAGGLAVETNDGPRSFAVHDRILFLQNDRALGVRNGTLGTVISVTEAAEDKPAGLVARTDDGREVAIDPLSYKALDHGYAVTIHKSQGATADEVHVLATRQFDRHLAYVAMTRHREDLRVYAAAADAPSVASLGRVMTEARSQDAVLDFIDARGLRELGIPTRAVRPGLVGRALAAFRGRAGMAGEGQGRAETVRARPGDAALQHLARGPDPWLAAQALAGQLREARGAGEGKSVQQKLRRELARKLRTLRQQGRLKELRHLYPEEFRGIVEGIGRGGMGR